MYIKTKDFNSLLPYAYEDKKIIQNQTDKTFAGIKHRTFIRKSLHNIITKLDNKNTPASEKIKAVNDLYEIGIYAKPAFGVLTKILKDESDSSYLAQAIKNVLSTVIRSDALGFKMPLKDTPSLPDKDNDAVETVDKSD